MECYDLSNQAQNAPIVYFYYCNDILTPNSWRSKRLSYNTCKLNLFIKGEFTILSGMDSLSPVRGDLCVLFPHEIHHGDIETPNEIEYFEFGIDPHAFDSIEYGQTLLSCVTDRPANIGNFCRPQGTLAVRMIETCCRILVTLRSESPDRFACAYGDTIRFLHDLNMAYKNSTALESRPVPDLCSRVMGYINENYADILTVNALAERFTVNPSHLIRTFRAAYGCTPYQYVIRLKVARAAELLLSGANVTEACFGVGFSDCSRFIQVFKRYMGKTPMQYRREASQ